MIVRFFGFSLKRKSIPFSIFFQFFVVFFVFVKYGILVDFQRVVAATVE